MTTLTTHDTKRSEDIRARLMALAEDAQGWGDVAGAGPRARCRYRTDRVDAPHGVPRLADPGRHLADLRRAARGVPPQGRARGQGPHGLGRRRHRLRGRGRRLRPGARARDLAVQRAPRRVDGCRTRRRCGRTSSAQKLLQLTMPGVPDVYQGCELGMLSLVDPDNRRPVDWTDRRRAARPGRRREPCFDLDDEKLRGHRPRAAACAATTPRRSSGRAPRTRAANARSEHALAFVRGDDDGAACGHRGDPRRRAARGGRRLRRGATVALPAGTWRDVLREADDESARRAAARRPPRGPPRRAARAGGGAYAGDPGAAA